MKIHCLYDDLVDLDNLKPHPKNRNKHPEDQIKRLAQILLYQGWRYPVKVSKLSGHVTSGHGRIEAAKVNGWKNVPVNFQEYENENQEYADVQADNAIASWSELDFSAINTDLGDLGPDFDIDLLGIKNFEIEVADKFQGDPDDVPEIPKEPQSKLGDLYFLGKHRLLCGDSTSIDDVERLMNGEKADMVFTDPPYGMFLDTDYSSMSEDSKTYHPVIGDGDDFRPELIQTCLGIFSYCSEVFLFGADYYSELIPNKNKGSWIVWDKRQGTTIDISTNIDKKFGSCFELCWSKTKHKRDIARILWSGIFGEGKNEERVGVRNVPKRYHPTQKPIALAEWFFERWGKPEDNVVDLYGGSGSTLIACEKTNRKCFMMEIDPLYCDVIVSRYVKFTGKNKIIRNGEEISWQDQG